MNWISRLGALLQELYDAQLVGSWAEDRDADRRRILCELDAIRVHFPDHA
ncbi:MAG TPA: hypothetical protein VHI10_04810 [Mycobacterium sp.]|nr:hypothetical protein [Mycobacterium sp.]